ncbi:hypothetical protein [Saliphagus infecundisoli]|uniref:Uncharacterized protein n=1 Tax=Saliphagus infecundisoli TaxID=1849069 RepID=A0ABD5QIP5_9EURY|nr:hypothetical protein [Saliphagus infecundisoli]
MTDAKAGEPVELDEDDLGIGSRFQSGLLRLTTGALRPVYSGGLVMARLRRVDPDRRGPGLLLGANTRRGRGTGLSTPTLDPGS